MTKKHILLIDDDQELAELLTDYLTLEGFELQCAYNGLSGLKMLNESAFDLILLDVMMPELNGFDVLKALGGSHKTPVMMLTARGDNSDKILGLELGADDYLAKPFNHRELLARINAIFRRINILTQTPKKDSLTLNGVRVDYAVREVHCHEVLVELTGTEYEMLNCLIENNGKIVSKESLSENVLGRKLSAYDRSIDMHISNLRRKLLPFSPTDKIKTVRGAGYIFLTGDN